MYTSLYTQFNVEEKRGLALVSTITVKLIKHCRINTHVSKVEGVKWLRENLNHISDGSIREACFIFYWYGIFSEFTEYWEFFVRNLGRLTEAEATKEVYDHLKGILEGVRAPMN